MLRTITTSAVAPVAALLFASGAHTVAVAQTGEEAETVNLVVVNVENAPLRCGSGLTWYAVAELERGQTLEVQGESLGFFRVAYPDGIPSMAKITDGMLDRDAGTVRLSRRSTLMAFNLGDPFADQCYKRVFSDDPLPPGTVLEFLGPMQDRKGQLAGYKVATPPGAVGYVAPGDIRPATDAERAAWLAARGPQEDPASAAQATPAEAGDTPPATPPAAEAQPDDRPATAPASTPTTPAETIPAEVAPAPELEMRTRPSANLPQNGDVLELLDEAFQREMSAPLAEAEFDELIHAYATYRDATARGDSAELVREYVDTRIKAMEIRQQLQGHVNRLERIETAATETDEGLRAYLQQVASARGFDVVGRLVPSTIYDGDRAPLMYRVISVTPETQRTVAYVLPTDGVDLAGMSGSLVGVRGSTEAGSIGRASVISPTSIERLNASGN